ncbi:hypothetical protein DENSPDRAFT_741686, partial [Dentipellis sp. KUC8613]
AGSAISRIIREMTKERTPDMLAVLAPERRSSSRVLSKWRIAAWRPWQDRKGGPAPALAQGISERIVGNTILTLNINGFHSKKLQIVDLLLQMKVAVACFQETRVMDRHYPIRVNGYQTFVSDARAGFRGLAMLVDHRLAAYEVPHTLGIHGLYVKVAGLPGFECPVHIIGLYCPSGGNERSTRTTVLRGVCDLTASILEKDPEAHIVVLGDLNKEAGDLDKFLGKRQCGLSRLVPTGSSLTRFPLRGRPTAIDHLLVSERVASMLRRPRVLR